MTSANPCLLIRLSLSGMSLINRPPHANLLFVEPSNRIQIDKVQSTI